MLPLAVRISRSANNSRVQDCKIKPNAVKAVTALHLKMTAHAQPASRFQKPKQANQTAGQARQAHAPTRRTYYAYHHKTNIQTQQTSSDKIVTWRCDHQCICLGPHACFPDRIATPTLLLPTSNRSGVDTCGVASGHTQMTMPPCARSFSGHYESLPLAIGCRNQRAGNVLGNIPQMAPAFRTTTLVGHHGLEGVE